MEHTGTKYQSLTFREHVRLRPSVHIGSKQSTQNNQWAYDSDVLSKRELCYPIALYNICDEIILNAIDHCLRTSKLKGKNKCDTIKLSISDQGLVTCFNNGEGIVVEKQNGKYIPEMIFTKEMSGSNFENDSDTKIGANGIGAKASCILSKEFIIKTLDLKNKLKYSQTIRDGNLEIEEPIISKCKASDTPYTEISFIPDYEYFEYNDVETMKILLRTRMLYVSAYLGSGYKIFFNEEPMPATDLEQLARMAVGESPLIKVKSNQYKVYIAKFDCESNTEHISFINGLYLSHGGTHIKYIVKHILESLKPRLEKKLKGKIKVTSKLISNLMMVFFSGEMSNLEYTNQSKNELSVSETRFKDFTFDKKSIDSIWGFVEESIDQLYLNKISKESTSKKVSQLNGIKKYMSAHYSGTAKSKECTLFIPEGDSAESCVRNGLSGNQDLGFNRNGLFNIQGVPLNARKEVDIKTIAGKTIIDKKKKLLENERLSSLVKVLNLNWHYSYETEEQINTLRYGRVVIAVDADTDGIGNICSLILNFFNLFFPELIKRGFLYILQTPLVRAYPKKKGYFVEEFYSVREFEEFSESNDLSMYEVNYIKGLATHSNAEISHMFKDLDNKVKVFKYDDDTDKLFEAYYGNDSDKRKEILSTKCDEEYEEGSCSNHLSVNAREYQLENIQRKMPHIIDGLNPARRKVLCGAILKSRQTNNKLKVFQLGGFIAEKMFYHHGSDSLNNTIVNMAQSFPGARNIPLLLPIGQFGTHYQGGKDAGSARYIDTKLNKEVVNLLYPLRDMDILEYTIIDGQVGEPKYFIPILPMAILEDVLLPATGWKIEIWARDFDTVCANVFGLINKEIGKNSMHPMRYFTNKFKGTEIDEYLLGSYIVKKTKDSEYVIIKSLPPRVWIDNCVEHLRSLDYVINVKDKSTIDEVNIEVKMPLGTLAKLKEEVKTVDPIDYIQKAFKLYVKMSHCINVYSQKNTVLETSYEEILYRWFLVRKLCYRKRIAREMLILENKILLDKECIRFIMSHDKYKLSEVSDSEADGILEANEYVKFNKSVMDSPGRRSNEELQEEITGNSADYSYLLNMSYRQMTKSAKDRLEERIKKHSKELEFLEDPDAWKKIWIQELNDLIPVLKKGFAEGFYREDSSKFKA